MRAGALDTPIQNRSLVFTGLLLIILAALTQSGCPGATSSGSAPSTFILNASTTSLTFGNVTIGNSSTLPVKLTNAGNSNVNISNISILGAGVTTSGVSSGQILTAGQTATLNVTFAPSSTVPVNGNVTVTSNATNSPAVISLSGTGVTAAQHSVGLIWSPNSGPGASFVAGYFVYRGPLGGPYSKLNSSADKGTSYTDATVLGGQTYDYVVTAVDASGVESAFSAPVPAGPIPSP